MSAGRTMVPSLADVLSTMAYHAGCLLTDSPSTGRACGAGIGGYAEGCPWVHVDFEIRPVDESWPGGAWGVWAQVWMAPHGQRLQCYGNRCGGREQLVKLYAPVIEWVAAYHAANAKPVAGLAKAHAA